MLDFATGFYEFKDVRDPMPEEDDSWYLTGVLMLKGFDGGNLKKCVVVEVTSWELTSWARLKVVALRQEVPRGTRSSRKLTASYGRPEKQNSS
jgi:hypothetical protein